MKVCPSCQSRFAGGEVFCPHDGTKLVDARELSPGELTGSQLGDHVRLDRLMFSDGAGERYAGRMLDSRRPVFVTVFNQALDVSETAEQAFAALRAAVGAPLPDQVSTVLDFKVDHTPPYIIENEPRGPSLRAILDESQRIEWKSATRIVANLARIGQWLVGEGARAPVFHPASVYVTRLADGSVQVADWHFEALLPADSPTRVLKQSSGSFVGYVDYMAPELADDSTAGDIRTTLYGLGCLLYEMIIGKPPLPAPTAVEAIQRHRHEKPVRLSIARGGGELPPELDSLVEMLLSKDPDTRFQNADALCAAMAGLLETTPRDLAPMVERSTEVDQDDLYRTIDMESIDRAALDPPAKQEEKTAAKASRVSSSRAISGESSTASDDDEAPVRKTLLFGSLGDAVSKRAAELDAEESADVEIAKPVSKSDEGAEDDDVGTASPTLMSFGAAAAGSASAAPKQSNDDPDSVQALRRSDVSAEFDIPMPDENERPTKKTSPLPSDFAAPSAASEVSDASDDGVAEEPPAEEKVATTEPAAEKISGRKRKKKPTPRHEETAKEPADTKKDDAPAAPEPAGSPIASAEAVGNVNQDDSIEMLAPNWFAKSTEEAWDSSIVHEEHRAAERKNRSIVVGIVAAVVVAAIGLFVWAEYIYSPEDGTEGPDENVTESAEADEPEEVDLAPFVAAFDAAMASDRLVNPRSNSAVSALEDLKRRGPESPEYEKARQQFVESAREAAKKADAAGNLAEARALAGYASQHAPDDAELARMTQDLQARFTNAAEADAGASTDAGADSGAADAGAGEEPPAEVAATEPAPKPEPPKKKTQRKKQQRKKQQPKRGSGKSADALVKEARAAFSRGEMATATNLYQEALKVAPNDGDIYAGLGKVYFERANYRQAVQYQQKAVRYSPGRMDYRVSLGQSFYRLGKYEQAITVWEGVLKKEPNNRFARQYIELAKKKL